MQVYIENQTKEFFDFRGYKKLITQAANTAAAVLKVPDSYEVNVLITDPETMRQINAQTREINKVTDVLSFPYFDFEAPGETADLFETEEETILGDIVLCAERIVAQAADYGHSQKRECAFLIVHSMLHLTGYDHMTKEEEAQMTAKANEIMKQLGIER